MNHVAHWQIFQVPRLPHFSSFQVTSFLAEFKPLLFLPKVVQSQWNCLAFSDTSFPRLHSSASPFQPYLHLQYSVLMPSSLGLQICQTIPLEPLLEA